MLLFRLQGWQEEIDPIDNNTNISVILLVCRYVKIGGLQRHFMCFYAILVSMIILIFYFILSVNLIYFSPFFEM